MNERFNVKFKEAMNDFLLEYCEHHMRQNRWNMSAAARSAKTERKTFYETLKRIGMIKGRQQ